MNNKKKIILGSIIGVLIGTLISVSYAFFMFSKTSNNNSQLVAGNIYMRYKESTTTINIHDMMPRSTKPNEYFEFTVEGTNTTENKDIIYDINIIHGDPYDDGDNDDTNDKVRIRDEFLRFTLEADLADGEGMHEVISNKKYSDFSNGLRMWVYQINKNTTEKVTHTYRLYVWIDSSIKIGNNDQDYTTSEWNNLFASVKVNVTGDFSDKRYVDEPPRVGDKLSDVISTKLTADNSDTDSDNVTYISGCSDEVTIDGTICTNDNKIDFNFVWYSGKLWRIVAIYSDGAMKLITENPITAINWGVNTTYNGSWVYQWLNEDFNDTLVNKDKTINTEKLWNATMTEETTKPAETNMVSGNVGLLNAYEYTESYKKANNKNLNGYLNIKQYWWLITPYSSWIVRYVDSGGFLNADRNFGSQNNNSHAVRPSIYLKSSITFAGGDGTRNNPYKIREDISAPTTNALLNTRISGEYVRFKGENFRIVGVEDGTTKIVKADYIMNGSDALKMRLADTVYFGKTGNTQSNIYLDYYLNNTWLPTSDTANRVLLDEGTYYLGEYGSTGFYKATICDTTISGNLKKKINGTDSTNTCTRIQNTESVTTNTYTGYVGLLRVGEMFSSQLKGALSSYPNMWLITPNSYSSNSVRVVNYIGFLDKYSPGYNNYAVRPTVNLKSTVKILSGSGTELDPFVVGL